MDKIRKQGKKKVLRGENREDGICDHFNQKSNKGSNPVWGKHFRRCLTPAPKSSL